MMNKTKDMLDNDCRVSLAKPWKIHHDMAASASTEGFIQFGTTKPSGRDNGSV